MNPSDQRFQTFITRVRPHRVAVLVNVADEHWQSSCLAVIEFLTKLWGGTHCIIVPTDGNTIEGTFWSILSAHDPDKIYRYQRTGLDERLRDPDCFAKMVADEVTREATENNWIEDQLKDVVEKSYLEMFFGQWVISDKLHDELVMRLAPFHFEKVPIHGMPDRKLNIRALTLGSSPGHPLTGTVEILKGSTRPKHFAQIVRDIETAPPPLWLASTIGSCDEEHCKQLQQVEITPHPVLMSQNSLSQIIKWGVSPRATIDAPFPFGLTRAILTSLIATKSHRYELPTVVVVGDSIRDFCLYHALYWQLGRALWIPSWFMPVDGQSPERLVTALREAEENGRYDHNEHLSFVSFSIDKKELEELKQRLYKSLFRTTITIDDITPTSVASLLLYPTRLFAEKNINDVTTHLLINNRLPGAFESPLPRMLNPINAAQHRWLVDITFLENLIPRHPALGQVVVTGSNVGDVRSGSEAVSYLCPGTVILGDHMETNMLRPSIHVPVATEIFRIVLDDCDYRSRTSDKGRYEETAVRKFGGLDKAGYALWSGRHRELLTKFLDTRGSSKGDLTNGVYLNGDSRRYMDFASINAIMQDDKLSYELIDEYVEKSVFYRGYIFQCEDCSDRAWHSIVDVDQTFTCSRCGKTQQYKHRHWKMPNEPLWFYKLDEMIYLMLRHDGDVPLLTLNKLRLMSSESFLFCHELRLMPKDSHKSFLEMDICCIANGKLCIGEAKSKGDLASKGLTAVATAGRYRDLALKMGASMVVFSTTAATWSEVSKIAIETTFAPHPHIDLKQITSAGLFGA